MYCTGCNISANNIVANNVTIKGSALNKTDDAAMVVIFYAVTHTGPVAPYSKPDASNAYHPIVAVGVSRQYAEAPAVQARGSLSDYAGVTATAHLAMFTAVSQLLYPLYTRVFP